MCCDAIIFRRSGKAQVASCRGELARALGIRWKHIPNRKYEDQPWWSPKEEANSCLCHVDFDVLGRMFGMAVERPSWDDDCDHRDAWALRETTP